MTPAELRTRTKRFALDVLWLLRTLPRTDDARILGKQLLRSAISVAANYRAANRSRSRVEFASKIGTVIEETDESMLWLELLTESELATSAATKPLLEEAEQLVRIFVASRQTARRPAFTRSPVRSQR